MATVRPTDAHAAGSPSSGEASGASAPWIRRAGSVVWECGKGIARKASPHMTAVRVSCTSLGPRHDYHAVCTAPYVSCKDAKLRCQRSPSCSAPAQFFLSVLIVQTAYYLPCSYVDTCGTQDEPYHQEPLAMSAQNLARAEDVIGLQVVQDVPGTVGGSAPSGQRHTAGRSGGGAGGQGACRLRHHPRHAQAVAPSTDVLQAPGYPRALPGLHGTLLSFSGPARYRQPVYDRRPRPRLAW